MTSPDGDEGGPEVAAPPSGAPDGPGTGLAPTASERGEAAVNWVRVAEVDDLSEGEVIGVMAGNLEIAVYRLGLDEFYATDNVCTHAFAFLSDGWLEDGVIECALHAGRFDVRTGKGLCAPVEQDLRTYPVRRDGTNLLVAIPAIAPAS